MKVLLLTSYYPPEVRSASQLMNELAQGLVEREHSVIVVTPLSGYNLVDRRSNSKHEGRFVSQEDGVTVVRVPAAHFQMVHPLMRGFGHLVLPFSFLVGSFFSGRVDIISVYSPPLVTALGALFISKLKRVPFVVNVQDLFPKNAIDLGILRNTWAIKFFRVIENLVYKHATRIIVHSEGNSQAIKANVSNPSRVVVLHNWVDLNAYSISTNSQVFASKHDLEGLFLVLFAGVMGYAQDLENVIMAARQLQNEAKIAFLLIGDGIEKAVLVEKTKALGLTNVRFLPWVSPKEYPQVVSESHIGLVTLKETMKTPVVPSKLLGYMAAGKPVVASVNPESDAITIVKQAKCGLSVEPGNSQVLADAIRHIYRLPDQGREMGKRGRVYAETNFAKEVILNQYENILQQSLLS